MIDPNALKPVAPKTTNELTDSHTIIDVGQRTNKTIQKIGTIGVIALAIIIVLVVILILKRKKKG